MSSYSFNCTTTLQTIPIQGLVSSKAIVIQNNDVDNNVFYNPNPNGTVVLTAAESITPSAVSGNTYSSTSTSVAIGDKVIVTTVGGVVYVETVSAVVSGTSFTVVPASGHTVAATDTIVLPCHKLMDGTTIKSASFPNGLKVKHKDNTGTGEYQISIIEADTLTPVSPFFFKG